MHRKHTRAPRAAIGRRASFAAAALAVAIPVACSSAHEDGATTAAPLATAPLSTIATGGIFGLPPPAVTTHHNDAARSGANLNEPTLTRDVVKDHFGLLGRLPLDAQVFAQPLFVPNVSIPGKGTHNVLYVATARDSLYAYDADSLALLWQVSLLPAGQSWVPCSDYAIYCGSKGEPNYKSMSEIGITSTPVIDLETSTIYVLAVTKVLPDGNPHVHEQRLHAIDLATGAERPSSPAIVGGSYNGFAFDPLIAHQRAALSLAPATLGDGLAHKAVHIAWASYGDRGKNGVPYDYAGWVMSYDAATLTQRGIWCNGCGVRLAAGGIWQAGAGIATDAAGDLYFMTGNGENDGVTAFGDSFIKLHLDGTGLHRVDWFIPQDVYCMEHYDADLGSSGPVVLPDLPGSRPHQLLGGGKTAKLYLLDRDGLGRTDPSRLVATQSITGDLPADDYTGTCAEAPPRLSSGLSSDPNWTSFAHEGSYHMHGSPVVWNGPSGVRTYVWSEQNFLRCYQVDGSHIGPCGEAASLGGQGPLAGSGPDDTAMPGAFLSLSAASSTATSAILWASLPSQAGDGGMRVLHGVLRAFDASTMEELWSSDARYSSDARFNDYVGNFAKFVPPTVVNGRVYLPAWHNPDPLPNGDGHVNELLVYGVRPTKTNPAHLPGGGTDIGIGLTDDRDVWIIGNDAHGAGFSIFHWNNDTQAWNSPAGTATSIDVGPDGPWVVNNQKSIFKWDGSQFNPIVGAAHDIGIAANGDVFVVGDTPGDGGFGVLRYNGVDWDAFPGNAVRIDVTPGGLPWVVNAHNEIFRWQSWSFGRVSPFLGTFEKVDGAATDIGVGADNSVYVIGTVAAGLPGNFQVYKWDGTQFNPVTGASGVRISAGPKGLAVTNAQDEVWVF